MIDAVGGAIGEHPALAKAALAPLTLGTASATEKKEAMAQAKEQYLATAFIMGADRRRYGSLIEDLENQYAKTKEQWPQTLTDAYALLCNWRQDRRNILNAIEETTGISYAMASDDAIPSHRADSREGVDPQGRWSWYRRPCGQSRLLSLRQARSHRPRLS